MHRIAAQAPEATESETAEPGTAERRVGAAVFPVFDFDFFFFNVRSRGKYVRRSLDERSSGQAPKRYYRDSVASPSQPASLKDISLYQFFAPGGLLSRTHPAYEFRRGNCLWRKRSSKR